MGRTIKSLFTDRRNHENESHWDILFVSDRGRMIRVKNFKRHVVLTFLIVVMAVIIAASFFLLFTNQKRQNNKLKNALNAAQADIATLVDEKDELVAKVVALQGRLPETSTAPANEAHPQPEPSQTTPPSEPDAKDKKKAKPNSTVAIDDFSAGLVINRQTLKLRFLVKKTDPRQRYVSGRIFVIMHGPTENDVQQVLPPVHLENGLPTRISKGQYFSIARFKPVTMSVRTKAGPDDFTTATIIIFSPENELIFKKTIPVQIQMMRPTPKPQPEPEPEPKPEPEPDKSTKDAKTPSSEADTPDEQTNSADTTTETEPTTAAKEKPATPSNDQPASKGHQESE